MPEHLAKARVKRATLEATVIRADGSREELGVIAAADMRWWRRVLDRVLQRGRIQLRQEGR